MPGPILIVLLAAATEELQAVLAGLVAAEAAAQREGAGIEEALLVMALLDVIHGRQVPVLALERLIHCCGRFFFATERNTAVC